MRTDQRGGAGASNVNQTRRALDHYDMEDQTQAAAAAGRGGGQQYFVRAPLPPVTVGPPLSSPSSAAFPAAAASAEDESEGEENEEEAGSAGSEEGGKRRKVSKFIGATYAMLMDASNASAIRFSEDGTSLEIIDPVLLRNEVLAKYFNHNTLSSFTRQLHNYNFEAKPSRTGVHQTFSHPSFLKSRVDLLDRVQRKIKLLKKPNLVAQLNESIEREEALLKRVKMLEEETFALTDHNRTLQHENRRLLALFSFQNDGWMHQCSGVPPPPPPPPPPQQQTPVFPAPLPVAVPCNRHQQQQFDVHYSSNDGQQQQQPPYQQQQRMAMGVQDYSSMRSHPHPHQHSQDQQQMYPMGMPESSPLSSPTKAPENLGWFE